MGNRVPVSAAKMDFVKKEIASAPVVMFSKNHCPFCTKAQRALKSINQDYKLIELNGRSGKIFRLIQGQIRAYDVISH